jgi:hypothetical protein
MTFKEYKRLKVGDKIRVNRRLSPTSIMCFTPDINYRVERITRRNTTLCILDDEYEWWFLDAWCIGRSNNILHTYECFEVVENDPERLSKP